MINTLSSSTERIFDAEKLVCFSMEQATVTEIVITEHSSIAFWGAHPVGVFDI
ncbi:MAG: hypothetical protein WBG73_00095 [Coleofasciculaceae cyanobacterium]